ncbi:hypothetical protein [Algoriphagus resistens]|uniref:hypothetical protein n=1 Tax=Algoriphagus resistens TaxID=1750590 RepID=UPI000716AC71|nr:hypothetical protein [Algoriphagus resistens]
MKKISVLVLIGICFCSSLAYAQTAIGKNTVDGDGLLDFAAGSVKGIILPAVSTLPATPANGTFILDRNDRKLKMYSNNQWVDLSDEGDTGDLLPFNGANINSQTVIGAESTNVEGALVLESDEKALVLPKVASPHLNVPSPYPGMMCYDTDAKAMAVFDGAVWNYWK